MEQSTQTQYKLGYKGQAELTREQLSELLKIGLPDYIPSDNLWARLRAAIDKTPQDKPKAE